MDSTDISAAPHVDRRPPRVALVVPIYNEIAQARQLMERIGEVVRTGQLEAAIMVDDGSSDGTSDVLADFPWAIVHRHPRRLGCGASIRSGYEEALGGKFDIVVVMAGNGKDNPAEIPQLLAPLFNNTADYVQGSRFLEGGLSQGLPLHRRFAMRMLTTLFRLSLRRPYTDCTNGFRAYRIGLLKHPDIRWKQEWLGNDYQLEIYMHYKAVAEGFRVVEVPVSKIYRRAADGTYSKARLKDWFTGLSPLVLLRLGLRR